MPHGLRTLSWIVLASVLSASRGAAQAGADTTAKAVPRDSVPAVPRDSTAALKPDTTVKTDSTAAPDTARAAKLEAAPADTVLAAACASSPPGSSADGLLEVVFRAHSTERERSDAAKEVGGELVDAADGGQYVRLPGTDASARNASERLIQLRSVASVSEISCPG